MSKVGDRVTIDSGRYAGKAGVLVDWSLVHSGQDRIYPVVRLDDGREVRVLTVTAEGRQVTSP